MMLKSHGFQKKLIALSTAALLLATSLAGCASGNKEKQDAATSNSLAPTSAPADTGPKKLTISLLQSANVKDYASNYLTKLIEKRTNAKLEIITLPSVTADALTKVSLMVASGATLPDVFCTTFSDTTILDYATKGVFRKLNDYYNNPKLNTNYMKIPADERKFIYDNIKLSDGNVYALPKYIPAEWNEGATRFWVNGEWLKKLNLKTPTTTDEFYTVLKAFGEQDPNGNGKKDEIGIVGSKDGWSQQPWVFLMNAFTYANDSKNYLHVENGKIVASFVKPEWKQGLEYMAKLLKEGLYSPLSFTQDQKQLQALVNKKDGVAGFVASGSYSVFVRSELGDAMTLLAPLTGPGGASYATYNPTLPTGNYYITKDCKDPEFAFLVGDYMLGEEASWANRWGELGVDWTNDPKVTDLWMGKYEQLLGWKTKVVALNQIWGVPQDKHWTDAGPGYRSREGNRGSSYYKKSEGIGSVAPDFNELHYINYVSKFPKENISKLLYTNEELQKIASIKTTIDAYVIDSAVAFITGHTPLTDWDKYVKELEKMGLKEYLAAAQIAYDRVSKK